MPTIVDVFSQDAFNLISMTRALENLPYQEMRLGAMGLFDTGEGVESDTVVVDETDGILQVLANRPRGSEPERAKKDPKAKSHAITVPHFQFEDRILAASLFGKRQPGETFMQAVTRKVNDRQTWMRGQIEVTHEIHRLNALKGILLDSDGSTIHNFFTIFNVAQQSHDFVLSNATTKVRSETVEAKRKIESALGGVPYMEVRAICGKNFFDDFIEHPFVRDTYIQQEARTLRDDIRYTGFTFGGVVWEEYRGMSNFANDIGIVDEDEAVMFPVGVPGMYRQYNAPGDFVETVNTLGLPMYSKVAPDLKYNRWVDLLAETNPLFLNTRPRAVLKITKS